jgi:hypothetical protein
MSWEGGCLCGAVRYQSAASPRTAGYCHCRMCQRASGGAFGVFAVFAAATFQFTRGAPRLYRSSAWAERGFCADCGAQLTFRYLADPAPDWLGVTVGSLDAPGAVKVKWHTGVESAVPWHRIDDDLPRTLTAEDPGLKAVKATLARRAR